MTRDLRPKYMAVEMPDGRRFANAADAIFATRREGWTARGIELLKIATAARDALRRNPNDSAADRILAAAEEALAELAALPPQPDRRNR